MNHSAEEYVCSYFWHVNSVEGYFSLFKRAVYGCFFHVSEAHLHRYAGERNFIYNHRERLGFDDQARADAALKGVKGKRLIHIWTDLNSGERFGHSHRGFEDPRWPCVALGIWLAALIVGRLALLLWLLSK